MDKTEEMEACRLCGGKAELDYHCGARYVECQNEECGNQGPLSWLDCEAISGWNEQNGKPRRPAVPEGLVEAGFRYRIVVLQENGERDPGDWIFSRVEITPSEPTNRRAGRECEPLYALATLSRSHDSGISHSERMARRMGATFDPRSHDSRLGDELARWMHRNPQWVNGDLFDRILAALRSTPAPDALREAATIIGGFLDVGSQDAVVRRARAWLDANPEAEAAALAALRTEGSRHE